MLSSILPASSLRSNSVNSVAPHVGEKLGDKLFRIRADFQKEFPTRIKKVFFRFFSANVFFSAKNRKIGIDHWLEEKFATTEFFENFFLCIVLSFGSGFLVSGFFSPSFYFRWRNCPNKSLASGFVFDDFYFYLEIFFIGDRKLFGQRFFAKFLLNC